MEDKTIQILQSTLERSPELWDTRQQLAELLWSSGDVQGTSDVLSSAPEWPSDEGSLEFAASVFAHTNHAYSIDLYRAVLERNSSNARAHAALARLYMEAGDRDACHQHHLSANVIDQAEADPHVGAWLHGEPIAEESPAAQEAYDKPAAAPVSSTPEKEALHQPDLSRFTVPAPSIARKHRQASDYDDRFELAPVNFTGGSSEQQEEVLETASKQRRTASLIVAGLVHVLIGVLLYFIVIHNWPPEALIVVNSVDSDPGPPKIEKQEFAKAVRRKPNPASSSARAQIITTNVAMPIAVEEVEEVDPDAFGVAAKFGHGLGFGDGDGDGGGTVMFFGDSAEVSRAIFIVDFSGSMSQGSRIATLKKELDRSLSTLPAGVSYNVIYYSHRPWLGGENVGSAPFRDPDDPKDRIPWLKATKDNIQRSRDDLANMQIGGATNWIPPTRMALSMVPPPRVIWLLTDGEASDREEMIIDMARINPNNVRINTIGMEIGGPTFGSLIEIAEMTGGKSSIVMDGQLHTGAAARKFAEDKFAPKN
ncbi:MAG: hypothetical protein ACI8XO_005140 [Verrucomicrobiales bacterium]|jgi:hypothetical protein